MFLHRPPVGGAPVTPAEQHTLTAALAEVLDTWRRNLRCRRCLDRGFFEVDEGEYGSCREVVCRWCGGEW